MQKTKKIFVFFKKIYIIFEVVQKTNIFFVFFFKNFY